MLAGIGNFFAARLERKLALLLSLVALLTLLVLGWLAIPTISATRQRDVSELEWQLVNQHATRVKKYIDDKLETFRVVLVGDVPLEGLGDQHLLPILQGQLDVDASLRDVSFVDPVSAMETHHLVRASGSAPLRTYPTDDPLFGATLQGKSYLGSVTFEPEGKYLTIANPVTDRSGRVVTILRGEVDLAGLSTLVAQANLGSTGYLYIVDKQGRLLAHASNLTLTRKPAPNEVAPLVARRLLISTVRYSFQPSSSYHSSLSNQSVFAVARSLSGLGWGVVAEWPQDEAMQPVTAVIGRLLLALVGLLAIVVLGSILLARHFARPLRNLRELAEAIGQGKFDVSVATSAGARDEVGELARAFDSMAHGLKELERLKDEFVFIAAHELRTPVTAIRGYAEMLGELKIKLPPQGSEFVLRLQQAGARLANLVNDLLEVARSQAGRLKVQTSPQDIVAIIQATLSELTPLAQEKRHAISFMPPASLPRVMADKDKLTEVLVNLIGNAIKYTPAGGRIEVGVSSGVGGVTTAIKDSGIGISAADQAKLFERFFRVESEATKSIQGTGLGLFIVRQLVERMGGKIWVVSETGKGSTFSFSLSVAV